MSTESPRTMPARRRDDQRDLRDTAFAVVAIIALIAVFLLAAAVLPVGRG